MSKHVNLQTLPEIIWQTHKVITTDLLAQCYETDVKYIQKNYSRNEKRFIEGKHFFKLEGDALRSFKLQSNNGEPSERGSVKIAVNINSLILWTERGAARHAKILDNDKAWDVFDQMEEVYFHPERKAEAQPAVQSEKQQIITLQQQLIDSQKSEMQHYRELAQRHVNNLQQDKVFLQEQLNRLRHDNDKSDAELRRAVRAQRPIEPVEKSELLAMFKEGWTIRIIANHCFRSPRVVRRCLLAQGAPL